MRLNFSLEVRCQSAPLVVRPDKKEGVRGVAPAVELWDEEVLAIQAEARPVAILKAGKDPGRIPGALRAITIARRDTFPENVGLKEAEKTILVTIIR